MHFALASVDKAALSLKEIEHSARSRKQFTIQLNIDSHPPSQALF
jgi:hypothetical protein